ncbi:MAG: diguanylate cyclase [Oscillospiraceae bacterium]|nr:diguanylate cyclase [Oscillospiraceae bacterium]
MKLRRWSALLLLLCMILALSGLYVYCGTRLDEALRIEAQNTVSATVQEYTAQLYKYLDAQKDTLRKTASMLAGMEPTGLTQRLADAAAQEEGLDFLGVIYPGGVMYGSDGKTYQVNDPVLLRCCAEGEAMTAFEDEPYADVEGAVFQTCPIYWGGEPAGLLYSEFSAQRLGRLMDHKELSGNGTFAIIQSGGVYVYSPGWSDDGNFFTYLNAAQLQGEMTAGVIQRMIDAHVTGKYEQVQDGSVYYCDYRPLDVDDWYLVSRLDENLIQAKNRYFRQLGIAFGAGTGLIILLGGGVYIFLQRRQLRVMRQHEADLMAMTNNIQGGVFHYRLDEYAKLGYISEGFLRFMGYTEKELREKFDNCFYNLIYPAERAHIRHELAKRERRGEIGAMEYRMEKKNGEVVWIYAQGALVNKGKEKWVYVTALDITESKNVQEELQVSEECFHLIMEKTDSIIFQWDIPNDRVSVTDVWDKKFGYLLEEERNFSKDILPSITYEDDLAKHRKLFAAVESGKHYGEELVRIRRADETYIWCRVCLSGMAYRNQLPQRGVGVVIDIDKEKREMEEMQAMAERDSLSTLYNKGTTRRVISNFLANEGRTHRHAFMMIDIDDFKRINDTLGHMYGDAAIADVATVLKSAFRVSDVLGRIGGDEFVIFVKDISSREMMVEKAAELCRLIQTCYAGQNKEIQLTVSVGVAMFYEDGVSYDQLYRAADLALYRSKRDGKNRFTFYEPAMANEELDHIQKTPLENG